MSKDDRSKYWCGTSYDFSDFASLSGLRYAVWQRERCPSTGKLHFQFHTEFFDRLRFPQVQRLLPGAHIERVRDLHSSRKYAQKDESRVEGPWFFGSCEERKRKLDVVSFLKGGTVVELLQEEPHLWRSVCSLQQVRAMMMPKRSEKTYMFYIFGDTGCGKTTMMKRFGQYMSIYWKDHSKWWTGYEQQDIVVYDEYNNEFAHNDLLRFGDDTPMFVEYKGGVINFSSMMMVFLSNLHPAVTIFSHHDDKIVEALGRRFVVIRL